MRERLPHMMQALPFGLRCHVIPALEGLLGIRVALPEFSQSLLADDMHVGYIMYSSKRCVKEQPTPRTALVVRSTKN